jgi:RND family efflux transporter MFP subunit
MARGAESISSREWLSTSLGVCRALCAFGLLLWQAPGASAQMGASEYPSSSASEVRVVTGITAPNRQATIATLQQGRIERLPVAEGQRVEAGEPLIILDDRVQAIKTEFQRLESESTLDMEVSQARMEQARAEYERMVRLNGEDFASSKELYDAKADAIVKRLEHQIAILKHEQAIRLYERERLLLEQHHVSAPFDGYVSEHLKHVGETVEEREGVLTLVQLDPLKVVLDCPVTMSSYVREGGEVWVRPTEKRFAARRGTVVLVNRVADPASQTFRVKLTVDNADRAWISGLKVEVEFPEVEKETVAGRDVGPGGREGVAITKASPVDSIKAKAPGD